MGSVLTVMAWTAIHHALEYVKTFKEGDEVICLKRKIQLLAVRSLLEVSCPYLNTFTRISYKNLVQRNSDHQMIKEI